ncbi:MAG: hypothetical protein AABZ39_12610 [Spirochaetota bacterium]
MSISPLDLQQIYAQQVNVSRSEHARVVERALAVQSEDLDIYRDSALRDSTVMRGNETSESRSVRERREGKGRRFLYRNYRRRKGPDGEAVIEGEFSPDAVPGKGSIINILK